MKSSSKVGLSIVAVVFLCTAVLLIGCDSTPATIRVKPSAEKAAHAEKISNVLATLDKNHPRLMLKDDRLQELKKQYTKDKVLQGYIKDVLFRADGYMLEPPLVYKKIGKRLLKVSRECLDRIYALALAYRWTGQQKYAEKATQELLAVADFKDWNPLHFLDTAEMSHAVGIGYDWLYHYFDDNTRQKIKTALIESGLKPGISAYTNKGATPGNEDLVSGWWARSKFNWNLVCNSGLIIGALAIAESDPTYAEQILPQAIESMPIALKSYAPVGAWMEGPGYWNYATRYTAYGLSALDSALGKDFGLSQYKGLDRTILFPIFFTGPTGKLLNFADCSENSRREPYPCIFWLAKKFDNLFLADEEHAELAKYAGSGRHRAKPQHILWYVPPSPDPLRPKSLDAYFRGPVEVIAFRSAWDDPNALFIGIKAGYNQVDHGHLDLGSFELDALGVRWARDLGKEDYDLPGYWKRGKGAQRWSYYRTSSASHNVPMINNKNQDVFAKAKVIKYKPDMEVPSSYFVTIDLTSAYKEFATNVTRSLAMVRGKKAAVIEDKFELKETCDLAWGMTTDAEIDVTKKGTATLTLNGKKLVARIVSPKHAQFTVESAEQEPPLESNTGVKRLMVRLPNSKGIVQISILFTPLWPE